MARGRWEGPFLLCLGPFPGVCASEQAGHQAPRGGEPPVPGSLALLGGKVTVSHLSTAGKWLASYL